MYNLKDGREIHFVNVFDLDDAEKLKEFQRKIPDRKGVVYAIKIGDVVKIGCTRKPYDRVKTHFRNYKTVNPMNDENGSKFGIIVMTDDCFEYYSLENRLHTKFASNRIMGTELFNVDIDDVVLAMEAEFKGDDTNEEHQIEVLFANLLEQLKSAMDSNSSLIVAFANALTTTGKQLSEAEARISELEEMLLIREYTN